MNGVGRNEDLGRERPVTWHAKDLESTRLSGLVLAPVPTGIDEDFISVGNSLDTASDFRNHACPVRPQRDWRLDAGVKALRDPVVAPVQCGGLELHDDLAVTGFQVRAFFKLQRRFQFGQDERFHDGLPMSWPLTVARRDDCVATQFPTASRIARVCVPRHFSPATDR